MPPGKGVAEYTNDEYYTLNEQVADKYRNI